MQKAYRDDKHYMDGWDRLYLAIQNYRSWGQDGSIFTFMEGEGEEYKNNKPTKRDLLENIILAKDSFRTRTQVGLQEGKRYAIESVAEKFGLVEFEKWVILFFISRMLHSKDMEREVYPRGVIDFLRYNASAGEKLVRLKYFMEDSVFER